MPDAMGQFQPGCCSGSEILSSTISYSTQPRGAKELQGNWWYLQEDEPSVFTSCKLTLVPEQNADHTICAVPFIHGESLGLNRVL